MPSPSVSRSPSKETACRMSQGHIPKDECFKNNFTSGQFDANFGYLPVRRGSLFSTDSKRNVKLGKKYLIFCGFGMDGYC